MSRWWGGASSSLLSPTSGPKLSLKKYWCWSQWDRWTLTLFTFWVNFSARGHSRRSWKRDILNMKSSDRISLIWRSFLHFFLQLDGNFDLFSLLISRCEIDRHRVSEKDCIWYSNQLHEIEIRVGESKIRYLNLKEFMALQSSSFDLELRSPLISRCEMDRHRYLIPTQLSPSLQQEGPWWKWKRRAILNM